MAIIINDTLSVKKMADELNVESNKIESVKDSIAYILKELKEYWSETQEDQQSFYNGLSKCVESLETIHTCNLEFSNAIIDYMDVTEKISTNVIGG